MDEKKGKNLKSCKVIGKTDKIGIMTRKMMTLWLLKNRCQNTKLCQ